MKNSRKFTAMVAALALAACSVAPMVASFSASAAVVTDKGSIAIENEATGHVYEAYQIFDGDLTYDGVLSKVVWGAGIDDTKTTDLLTAVQGITLDNATKPFSACADAADVAKVLSSANVDTDAEITKKFASVVGNYLAPTATGTTEGSTEYKISDLDNGYYLVKDKDASLNEKDDAYTRYIVLVAGTQTDITPKSAKPTVMKKVQENVNESEVAATIGSLTETDKKWNDVADYNIGDSVPFKLYGTLPSADEYTEYDAYYYEFIDTLGAEFTPPTDASAVTVKVNGTTVTDAEKNMRIKIDGQSINVSFENVKLVAPNATDVITVEYQAVLNKKAVVGLPGQQNEVKLAYSNNPNENYKPNTDDETEDKPGDEGNTPVDKVIVFTYELDTTKVDKTNNATVLPDAEFKMQNADGKYAKVDDGGIFEGWVEENAASTLTSDANGKFIVKGIDDGTYTLIETKAPDGYDTPKDDAAKFTVTLDATTVNNQTWNDFVPANALMSLKLNNTEVEDPNHGIAQLKIENSKGSTLPSTGGMGTTLFYLVGGVLVAGAGVTLITKKRVSKNNK